ncbi:hypothetical protein MMC29_003705 [Sticta canariensis]|nr:hypothetical protein [Sticta canariensis]
MTAHRNSAMKRETYAQARHLDSQELARGLAAASSGALPQLHAAPSQPAPESQSDTWWAVRGSLREAVSWYPTHDYRFLHDLGLVAGALDSSQFEDLRARLGLPPSAVSSQQSVTDGLQQQKGTSTQQANAVEPVLSLPAGGDAQVLLFAFVLAHVLKHPIMYCFACLQDTLKRLARCARPIADLTVGEIAPLLAQYQAAANGRLQQHAGSLSPQADGASELQALLQPCRFAHMSPADLRLCDLPALLLEYAALTSST